VALTNQCTLRHTHVAQYNLESPRTGCMGLQNTTKRPPACVHLAVIDFLIQAQMLYTYLIFII
jgi:hypothetical protein